MKLSRLWMFLAVALPVLATLIGSLATVDLTYLIRAGEEIFATGRIPSVDTWTFTAAGLPWVDQQWGTEVIFAAVYRLGGWTGLVLLRAVLVGIIFGCVYAICRRRGNLSPRYSALLTLITFSIAAVALGLRAQALGMTFFAVLLLIVTERRAHPRLLWVIPPIVLVWANIHGSFFLAPLVLGLAWLEDLDEHAPHPHRTLAVAIVSALAACITPFGPAVWIYAAGLTTNSAVTNDIAEWQATSIRTVPGLIFFASVFCVAVVIARRGRATPWPTLAWLAVFFLIGVYAARGIAWWPLAAVTAVAGLLADPMRVEEPEPEAPPLFRRLNAAIVVLFVVVGVALLPVWRPVDARTKAPTGILIYAPPGITAALRDLAVPGDRVFNPQEWGSWLEFALPGLPVAMDSRIEFYPPEVWHDYAGVLAGSEGWEQRIATWAPTIAVIAKRDQPIVDRFTGLGWRSVYSDDDGSILLAPGR